MRPRTSPEITHDCRYRIVFCTKYRRPILINGADARFKELALEVIDELDAEMLELSVQPDRVDMLITANPKLSIHTVVKRIKARTSPALRGEFPWVKSRVPSLWTNNYFVATTGTDCPEAIESYLAAQTNA